MIVWHRAALTIFLAAFPAMHKWAYVALLALCMDVPAVEYQLLFLSESGVSLVLCCGTELFLLSDHAALQPFFGAWL